ncbi:hypothetical protein BB559_006293 [Furculomyces boomerangus]|uniref:Uncharacterized protein n=2 Tax=Harpellales TaxID=61421 RepID=A0A2T9Y3R6_9FUNG|nr:hypothetical protein BB559_006293 [Furculomyces boomerangus]PWA00045.1 hypothetical protein BB558_003878 [Smittium angustum]PWA02506.1 hypothetical protein BB558_001377 [Smittium angustum]
MDHEMDMETENDKDILERYNSMFGGLIMNTDEEKVEKENDSEDESKDVEEYEFALFSGSGTLKVVTDTEKYLTAQREERESDYEIEESEERLVMLRNSVIGYERIVEESKVPWAKCFYPKRVIHVDSKNIIVGMSEEKESLKKRRKKRNVGKPQEKIQRGPKINPSSWGRIPKNVLRLALSGIKNNQENSDVFGNKPKNSSRYNQSNNRRKY